MQDATRNPRGSLFSITYTDNTVCSYWVIFCYYFRLVKCDTRCNKYFNENKLLNKKGLDLAAFLSLHLHIFQTLGFLKNFCTVPFAMASAIRMPVYGCWSFVPIYSYYTTWCHEAMKLPLLHGLMLSCSTSNNILWQSANFSANLVRYLSAVPILYNFRKST